MSVASFNVSLLIFPLGVDLLFSSFFVVITLATFFFSFDWDRGVAFLIF